MSQDNKVKIGIIAAIGAAVGALGFVLYKFFPKMKECCRDGKDECCGSKAKEKCCTPKKK